VGARDRARTLAAAAGRSERRAGGARLSGTALVAGATGFVGQRLTRALLDGGAAVRAIVRDPAGAPARGLAERGAELRKGDVTDRATLAGAFDGVQTAYYLVHGMAGGSGFHERELDGARNFARAAAEGGVARVVYLGGLGDESASEHLRSRHATAVALSEHGPPLTYFRAAMVVGAGSESYRTLRYLVQRLPAMVAPSWLRIDTQPIAVADAIEFLARAPEVPESAGREVQIGGPDVLSYGEMLDRMADAMGIRRRPKVPVPLLTPRLSSLWIGLVTPVDTNVARPLVEGLRTPTVVTDASGAVPFGIEPLSFDLALSAALQEERSEA
jgi:uncharacterized protein YbjT (DUF2867 family)